MADDTKGTKAETPLMDQMMREAATIAAPQLTETIPSVPGGISGIASANAPFLYFDAAPFANHEEGVGMVTLTASRQIGMTQGGTKVANDFAVVAHLRGSLPAMARLRDIINGLLLHAATPEDTRN